MLLSINNHQYYLCYEVEDKQVLDANIFLKIKNCFYNAYFLKNTDVRITSLYYAKWQPRQKYMTSISNKRNFITLIEVF